MSIRLLLGKRKDGIGRCLSRALVIVLIIAVVVIVIVTAAGVVGIVPLADVHQLDNFVIYVGS